MKAVSMPVGRVYQPPPPPQLRIRGIQSPFLDQDRKAAPPPKRNFVVQGKKKPPTPVEEEEEENEVRGRIQNGHVRGEREQRNFANHKS